MALRGATPLVALALVLVSTHHASAHHYIGCANNTETTETVTGRITQVEWENPHVHLHLAAAVSGGSADWVIETQATYIMAREGLPQTAFKIGDTIQVVLWRAKDGSRRGFTKSITLNDRRTFAFNIAELRCPW
jgi:hypothetical protein